MRLIPSSPVLARWTDAWQLCVLIRVALLLFSLALVLLAPEGAGVGSLLLLAAVAALGSIPVPDERWARAQPLLEAALAVLVVTAGDVPRRELVPYLLAPALAAGLRWGVRVAIGTAGTALVVALGGHLLATDPRPLNEFLPEVARWTGTMLAVGLLAGWVRRIQLAEEQQSAPNDPTYVAAYRLLSQLRLVSRQLSQGLDPVGLSESLLQRLAGLVEVDRAVVLVRTPGGVLTPLAQYGAPGGWPASLDPESLYAEVWTTESPRARAGDGQGWTAALPLRIGVRTFGLVVLDRREQPLGTAELQACLPLVEEAALRLETALLFEEVRSIATADERRRVAREIHDGIAQELASLGYLVDDLAARTRPLPDVHDDLRALRAEVTRIISELRLSIFDLRSEVHSTTGLGTALSDYVQRVGAGSQLTVHLVLDESPERLRVEIEAELLRIAQEAITNARKHARAANLWVTCRIDPPTALLRVEDDGTGLGAPRDDSYGLEIMRERATRIGASFVVGPRPGGGTLLEVALGHAPAGSRARAAAPAHGTLPAAEGVQGATRVQG